MGDITEDRSSTTDLPIPRFSLLGPAIKEEEVLAHVAHLCRVSASRVIDAFPCTPLQEGLLALTAKHTGDYVEKKIFEIPEEVNIKTLRRAWEQVVSMNPILRTRIISLPHHGMVQAVLDEEPQWSFSTKFGTGELDRGSDESSMGLGTPLTRFFIFEDASGSPRHFLWEIHHALYDGHSISLLLKQAEDVYYNKACEVLEPMTAFVKHIINQDPATANAFWKAQFLNIQASATSHCPSTTSEYNPRPDCQISVDIHDLVWCRGNFTAATLIRAAWSLAMAQSKGSNEALFGVTVTGRHAPVANIERIAGPTIATVPVRVTLDWDSSVNNLLDTVQRQAIDMIPFEQTGLHRIRRISDEAEIACNFQTLLVIQPAEHGTDTPSRSFLSVPHHGTQRQHFETFPIIIECQLESNGVSVDLAFDSSIIEKRQMELVSANFQYLLGQLSDSKRRKDKIGVIVSESQYQWDLEDIWTWNSVLPDATEMCMHDLITRRVSENPFALAVCAWDGELSYKQLDDLSTNLAYQLVDKALTGAITPLIFEKSMWMPVAALAVMKAGGASVALDTTQPEERLGAVLSQANCTVVLSSVQNESISRRLAGPAKDILVVGPNYHQPASNPPVLPVVEPSSTLYVVFTSGSTGKPKGVIITHRNYCTAITYQRETLGYSSTSRVLDFASYAFDVAWSNLLNTLSIGGCLCIPSGIERDNDLGECFERYSVTLADLTPSVARILGPAILSRLSTLIIGGETVLPTDAYLAGEHTRVVNGYGPAECTPTATLAEANAENKGIGRGVGVCTWVVDISNPELLAPIGVVGELWIEGPLVGQGYLNNPNKTGSAFVENPSWLLRGSNQYSGRQGRVYRTGDLVRYNKADGTLVFIGRKDTQVKIRGQRVELGEVEYHVQHAIEDSKGFSAQVIADIVQPKGLNTATLVAFVTLSCVEAMTEKSHAIEVQKKKDEVTDRLATALPAYMVPTAFIPIQSIPITATGKTDRQQLRTIGESVRLQYRDEVDSIDSTEPQNEVEKILQQVWMSVLNVSSKEVSVDKAFTRLGGDSISAMQLVSRCRLHNIAFTVADVLAAGTIRKLAARCGVISRYGSGKDEMILSEKEPSAKFFNLSPMQQMWFDDHPDGLNHYNQSFLLKLSRTTPGTTLHRALVALVGRHSMLRARFQKDPESGGWMQNIIDESDPLSFSFAEHQVANRTEISKISQWRQENLDIQQGPVFAGDLFLLPENQFLLLSAHHLVIDLVSWRIIWNDLEEYVGIGELHSPQTASFRAWCKGQAKACQNMSPLTALPYVVPESDMSFWGVPICENTFANSEMYAEVFDHVVTSALCGKSNESLKTEPVDIIIGSMIYSFAQTFPERSVPVVWAEGHGREQSERLPFDLIGTVGWFTTLHPLPVPIIAHGSIIEAICRVKDKRRSVPGKGQPYFACRYYSKSGREAFQAHSDFELSFNFTGRYQQLESEKGLFKLGQSFAGRDFDIYEVSGSAKRLAIIETTAYVEDGLLTITFEIHKEMKHRKRIMQWIRAFVQSIKLATQELLQTPSSLTLSDLPLLPISYNGLESLLKEQIPDMGIKPSSVVDMYPCSPFQEGILLSIRKGVASYATHSVWQCVPTNRNIIPSAYQLEQAWKKVVSRHTILSTVFNSHPDGNGFVQIVLSGSNVRVIYLHAGKDNPIALLSHLEQPTFLAKEPQHAFTLCQSDSGELACRLDASHALVDAASMSILIRDLAAEYDGSDLPPAPPFSALISQISSIPRAQNIALWGRLLDGLEPCLFPASRTFDDKTDHTSSGKFHITNGLTSGITSFCKTTEVTRSVFLQTAWAMVISQFTGMREVCFGYMASGRDCSVDQIDFMVGPLVNLLISRVDLRDPAMQVLERTLKSSIEHLTIQHVSMADIQHQLGLPKRQLFNTSLSIQGADKFNSSEKRSLSFYSHDSDDHHEFDLSLMVSIDGDYMDVNVEFQEPYISQKLARDVYNTLSKAIEYLLTDSNPRLSVEHVAGATQKTTSVPGDALVSDSLFGGFFKHTVGTDETSTNEFWQRQFSNIQGTHFPPLKAAKTHPRLARRVKQVARGLKLGTDEFAATTMIRAALSIVISRILGSDEALFGATTGSRSIVPLRILVDGNSSTNQLLQEVQRQATEMVPFENTSLQRIRCLNDETAIGSDVQTLLHVFRVSSNSKENNEFGCDISEEERLDFDTYPLVVVCELQTNGANMSFNFDSNFVGELQVSRIGRQLEHVLHQLSDMNSREQKVRDISVISLQDIADIWTWNATVPEPKPACVHELILQQVLEQPSAPAISAWDGNLTYWELNELSTVLSRQLVGKKIGPGDIVPLCFEKSMWMPVAAFAVMKSGAAFVMIDTATLPEERIRSITVRVKATVIISSVANENLTSRLGHGEVLVVGADQPQAPIPFGKDYDFERDPGLPHVKPSDVLYIVFTSGSTGVPKGIVISHQNFCSAIAYQGPTLGFGKRSRVLDFASYASDVACSNLLKTLTLGGCLCIPSAAEREDDICGYLEKNKTTVVDLTPSFARHIPKLGVANLSTLLLGGEVVLPTDIQLVGDNTKVINVYGPAECTPTSTILELSDAREGVDDLNTGPGRGVGLGRGVGVCTWIAEADNPNMLAAIGAIGELWIEGPLVGQGYLDDPQRTAAAFIQDPPWLLCSASSKQSGRHGRLYRTGDLVRYAEDGSLLFIGRKDTQVKLRGQRIELDEVEFHMQQAIAADKSIANSQAVVECICPEGVQSTVLAAFIAPDNARDIFDEEECGSRVRQASPGIVDQLAVSLPQFMIPTLFIPIPRIPTMATGKIDRRKLRALGSSLTVKDIGALSRIGGERRGPQTEMEKLMQELWAKTLDIVPDCISIDDSFFGIGGDSIGVMRLVGVARRKGVVLTVRDVFRNPVLRDLAALDTLSPYVRANQDGNR